MPDPVVDQYGFVKYDWLVPTNPRRVYYDLMLSRGLDVKAVEPLDPFPTARHLAGRTVVIDN
jgi:hypothetical protein